MNRFGQACRLTFLKACVAALAIFLLQTGGVQAQTSESPYAVLIVGDEGDAEMLRREKVLIAEMGKLIRAGSQTEKLPIYSYHFNKERERAYCENKLNVLAEDLLFVGVVSLENKVPMKVVFRLDRIVNPSRAAKDILAQAEELVEGARPETIQVTPPTPATPPPAQPPAQPNVPANEPAKSSAAEEGFRVQLGSFTSLSNAEDCKEQAKKAGFEVVVTQTTGASGSTIYKVLSSVYKARPQADEALSQIKGAGFEQAFLTRAPVK